MIIPPTPTEPPTGMSDSLANASFEKSSVVVFVLGLVVFEVVLVSSSEVAFVVDFDELFDEVLSAVAGALEPVVPPAATVLGSSVVSTDVSDGVGLAVSRGEEGELTATDSALPPLHAASAPPASTVTALSTTT
jgi:hypothetical protein